MTKNKSISDMLESIVQILETYGSKLESDSTERIEIDRNLELIDKFKETLKGIRFALKIALGLIFALLLSLIYTIKNNEDIKNINSELQQQKLDSISKVILGINTTIDSAITYSYLVRGDEIVTYNQLAKEKDSISGLIDSVAEVNIDTNIKLDKSEAKLKHLMDLYGIAFEKIPGQDGRFRVMTPTLDSAMMLLAVYKDKLYYDNDTKKWYVIKNNRPIEMIFK